MAFTLNSDLYTHTTKHSAMKHKRRTLTHNPQIVNPDPWTLNHQRDRSQHAERGWRGGCSSVQGGASSTLTPQPSTLNPPPSTLNLQPSTLHPQPSTLHPQPSTFNPQLSTIHPQSSTLNSQASTLNSRTKPKILNRCC